VLKQYVNHVSERNTVAFANAALRIDATGFLMPMRFGKNSSVSYVNDSSTTTPKSFCYGGTEPKEVLNASVNLPVTLDCVPCAAGSVLSVDGARCQKIASELVVCPFASAMPVLTRSNDFLFRTVSLFIACSNHSASN
jgi:hypothetical protein